MKKLRYLGRFDKIAMVLRKSRVLGPFLGSKNPGKASVQRSKKVKFSKDHHELLN